MPFNDVVDLEDCWLRLDTHVSQDRHELRAESVKLGLTLKDVYHLRGRFGFVERFLEI